MTEEKLRAELENWEHSVIVDANRLHFDRFSGYGHYPSLSRDCLNVGALKYQLGQIKESRLWFAWMVRILSDFLPEVDTDSSRDHKVGVSRYAENAIVRAILLGHPQLREQAIEAVDNIEPDIRDFVDGDPRYHMSRVFVALVSETDDHVSKCPDTMRDATANLADDDEPWRQYFLQLATVVEAILAEDAATVETELAELLARHDAIARKRKDRTDVMDHRSGALVVLARERSLDVDPAEHEYLPTDLIELAMAE